MNIMNHCKNCAYHRQNNCMILGRQTKDDFFCGEWTKTLITCENCHQPIHPSQVYIITDPNNQELHSVCGQCAQLYQVNVAKEKEVKNG